MKVQRERMEKWWIPFTFKWKWSNGWNMNQPNGTKEWCTIFIHVQKWWELETWELQQPSDEWWNLLNMESFTSAGMKIDYGLSFEGKFWIQVQRSRVEIKTTCICSQMCLQVMDVDETCKCPAPRCMIQTLIYKVHDFYETHAEGISGYGWGLGINKFWYLSI